MKIGTPTGITRYTVHMCCVNSTFSGPRFVLQLIKVFEGSFGGPTLYENPQYITPNAVRVYVIT